MSERSPVALEDGVQADGAPGTLEARRLVRTFGALRALDGIDFALPRGAFLALFGPNGAGKSTLLRVLSGTLSPTSGELLEDGRALDVRAPEWQRRIGVLSHQTYLYAELTAAENLRFFGKLYGLDDLDGRIERGLAAVGLADRRHGRVETFSRGMRQRLGLARTLLHGPRVVFLDEPFTGLDAHASAVLRGVLEALRDGHRTVVMVTHNLGEGLAMADTVAVQVGGRLSHWGPVGAVAADFESFYRELVEAAA